MVEIKWSMSYPCLMIPIMSSSIRFELKLISGLPTNAPRPERVTNRQTDRRMYQWTMIFLYPHNLFGDKMGSLTKILKWKKESFFVMVWPWPLTHDHEKLTSSEHYHNHCVYQIWKQSIQCFLSYCVNHLCGGWPQHKTIYIKLIWTGSVKYCEL